jgi:hypothetical protein
MENTGNPKPSNPADLWSAYSKAVDIWMKSFAATQEAATNAFKMYLQGFETAIKSSNSEEMKKYNELWQTMAKQFEQTNPYTSSIKAWEEMWKESGFVSFKSFSDYWQNIWKNFAKDAEAKSQEALKHLKKSEN